MNNPTQQFNNAYWHYLSDGETTQFDLGAIFAQMLLSARGKDFGADYVISMAKTHLSGLTLTDDFFRGLADEFVLTQATPDDAEDLFDRVRRTLSLPDGLKESFGRSVESLNRVFGESLKVAWGATGIDMPLDPAAPEVSPKSRHGM